MRLIILIKLETCIVLSSLEVCKKSLEFERTILIISNLELQKQNFSVSMDTIDGSDLTLM